MGGWITKSISEVILKTKTIDPRKSPEKQFMYVDVSGVSNQTLEITESTRLAGKDAPSRARRVITEGDIIFATVRPTLRRIAMVPSHLNGEVCSTGYFVFQPKSELYNRYLYYFLQSENFMGEMEKLQKGTSYPAVNDSQVKSRLISYPSIPEQKRIVALLDTVFADLEQTRAKTEQNLKNSRELFDSYLQQVFSQKGDDWVDTDIETLVETGVLDKPIDGNHGETHPKKADFVEIGVPFIMASDIKNGRVDTQNCSFLTKTQADSLRKGFAKDGDVLLSHKATIGRTAILKTDLDYVMLTPQVTYYRVLDNKTLNNEYVYWYFNNPIFLNEMNKYAGVGSTRAYIGITKQRKLKFTYPVIAKQKKIVSKLKLMSKEIAGLEPIYKAKLSAIDELKKSILQKAFSGELTATAEQPEKQGIA